MNIRRGISMSIVALLVLSRIALGVPGEARQLVLGEDSKLWLEGDSTLHAYHSVAETILVESSVTVPVAATPGPQMLLDPATQARVEKLTLTIPVKDMNGSKPGLAGKLHKTMDAKEYPHISFEMDSYEIKPGDASSPYAIVASGMLTIRGKSSPVELVMRRAEDGHAWVEGEKELLMSDYGITPPEMFFGKMKVADAVVVKWKLNLELN